MWPHFFTAGELVLEVNAGGARVDHGLHQFEGVQHATEAGFGIGHDRCEVVDVVLAFRSTGSGRRDEGVVDRLTTFGTESTGYSDWSGYISPAMLASAATCQPDR
jgi:hypothetical protein